MRKLYAWFCIAGMVALVVLAACDSMPGSWAQPDDEHTGYSRLRGYCHDPATGYHGIIRYRYPSDAAGRRCAEIKSRETDHGL